MGSRPLELKGFGFEALSELTLGKSHDGPQDLGILGTPGSQDLALARRVLYK